MNLQGHVHKGRRYKRGLYVRDITGYLKEAITLPAYSCGEAGRIVRAPGTTVRAWIRGQSYRTRDGVHLFRRVILPADPDVSMLSFQNLIELYVLRSLRRVAQVSLPNIRNAIDWLRNAHQTEHPLADADLLTDRRDLFVQEFGKLLNISRNGQIEMIEELGLCMMRVEKSESGFPARLYPFREEFPNVAIDPTIRFGRATVLEYGLSTEVVYKRHESGESIPFLSSEYRCKQYAIVEAIRYEERLRETAA